MEGGAAPAALPPERSAGSRASSWLRSRRSPSRAGTAPRSMASWSARSITRPGPGFRPCSRSTADRCTSSPTSSIFEWQLLAADGFAVVAANPRGSSGRGEKFSTAIWADWGNKDGQDVLAAVDYAVAAGVADPARLGVGGLELRRHSDQSGDRARPAVQGGDQRGRAVECARRVRHRPVCPGVRGGAGDALGEPRGLAQGLVSPSSTPTGSSRRRCSSVATRTSTSRCSTPSRCTRRCGAWGGKPSS